MTNAYSQNSDDPEKVLAILDSCSRRFSFPMMDNGYVYLAATRLTVHRSEFDWAIVIEKFGYSPRGGSPDIHVHTFASQLHARDTREDYVNDKAYEMYLANNPHNQSRFFFPIEGEWQDEADDELVSEMPSRLILRGRTMATPSPSQYKDLGIELEAPPRVRVFELCRYFAEIHREDILATSIERCTSLGPQMRQILQLEEWRHPDLARGEQPSDSLAFQQIARVAAFGDIAAYQPTEAPNTHWSNWPDSGTL